MPSGMIEAGEGSFQLAVPGQALPPHAAAQIMNTGPGRRGPPNAPGGNLHPEISSRRNNSWKNHASVFSPAPASMPGYATPNRRHHFGRLNDEELRCVHHGWFSNARHLSLP